MRSGEGQIIQVLEDLGLTLREMGNLSKQKYKALKQIVSLA